VCHCDREVSIMLPRVTRILESRKKYIKRSLDRSVSIVSVLQAGRSGVRIPAGKEIYFSSRTSRPPGFFLTVKAA